ncbi:MAG: DegT/DnrJ/EryC1/StrS family aminotransferase [Methylococcales bacterium]|jgi:CDP-4-dehydro-6-deoxyglucose reductase, E1|nr:DegT/DnrJ/EryC1/StrS family aminotransferase [Methylococcales bacterium]MBT7444645.1 DegT/DnrJ/EryC1/StrS family aminotransferase [Methylococcales bacterium]
MKYELASSSWDEKEIAAMHAVIDRGFFTMGDAVKQFESDFAAKFKSKYALMTSSGSTANLLGVAALSYRENNPLQRGDEVIVPAISWATTYYPLQQYGLKLKFVDVDLQTLNMDVSQLEAALTPKTKMVVAVSILGNPAELIKMREFCDAHDLILFEDNCESMGAKLGGQLAGTFGDIGTFSSFFSHHIATMEGGMLITDDEEIYAIAKSMRAHGWSRDIQGSSVFEQKDDEFFEGYRFLFPGYNARPLELSGAIGVEQLTKLDGLVQQRRDNALKFVELFSKDERFIIQQENGESSWFSFTIILNPKLGDVREKVMAAMRAAEIQFRLVTGGCFLRHDVIRYFDYDVVGNVDNANIVHDRGFFVGNHPCDIRPQIDYLYQVLSDATPHHLASN